MPNILDFARRAVGNIFNSPTVPAAKPEVKQEIVPEFKKARISGWGEAYNISTTLDAQLIQAALRAAERGDTWQLFTIYRDMVMGFSHLQAEWSKRKMVVVGQPHSLIPKIKGNADDELACKVIQQMIDGCENWMDGLDHLLDATLYPLSVAEKLYQPLEPSEAMDYEFPVRFKLHRIDPVNYLLLCFKIPYLSNGATTLPNSPYGPRLAPNGMMSVLNGNNGSAMTYNPDDWEPDLTFFSVFDNGYINFSPADVYRPDPMRHIVHRGNMISPSIRPNFGGTMRMIMFWWFLANQCRDWYGRFIERFGTPFPVAKADAQQQGTIQLLQEAFSLSTRLGGLVVDKRAEVELIQAATQDGGNAHDNLIKRCNQEVSKIVIGQELSSTAKNTGLGSGVAALQSEVRDDIRQYDMRKLSETLKSQLFAPYLKMNGYNGHAPEIIWGGKNENDARLIAQTVQAFAQAGLRPTDDALNVIGQRLGYGVEKDDKLLMRGKMGGDSPSSTDLKESKDA